MGHMKEDRQATHDGHKLDTFMINVPLVPWTMGEHPHLAVERPARALGFEQTPLV